MKPEGRFEVLVAGDLFLDLVMGGFDSLPSPGEEAFARSFHKEIGGGAAITACGLSKLGLRTGVVGVVGRTDGLWIVEQLQTRGVGTSGIRFSPTEPTAFTVSVSTRTDRTFLTYCGANLELAGFLSDELIKAAGPGKGHLHLAHALDPAKAMATFRAIKEKGWTVSLDVGWHPDWYADKRAWEALKSVDLFFPNKLEAEALTGETEPPSILEALKRMGLTKVALKLGPDGGALLWDGAMTFRNASGTIPVDTTGAGDCFDAGFLYAWLTGSPASLCLKIATTCGELSTTAMGGVRGFPSKEELDSHLCTVK